MHWSLRCGRRFRWVNRVEYVSKAPKGQSIAEFRNLMVIPVEMVIKTIWKDEFTLTMHLTTLSCILISRLYVNLLT